MCGDEPGALLKPVEYPIKVEDNILSIDLFQFGALPKIGPADRIAAVRIHVRGKAVSVFAIYDDPEMTATMACCSGSGCTCYAHGCYC